MPEAVYAVRALSRRKDSEAGLFAHIAALGVGGLPIALPLGDGRGGVSVDLNEELFPPDFLFAGTPFAINRVIMVRLIATAVLVVLLVLYSKRCRLVPSRAQSAFEFILNFSKVSVGEDTLGAEAKRYQPLLATVFFGVLFMNITGIIPGLQIASTSLVGMPAIYALVAYFAFVISGIKERGFGHYFASQLFPPGVPKPIYILMTPIELLSTFIMRPITLTVRLLANMISGHIILVLCFVGTNALYMNMGGIGGIVFGSLTFIGGLLFTAFEAFIACLQAYIFVLLMGSYISLSISEH
ncbi:MAG: F0F1 ATP synthase subunit A [Actinomycetaceae bacterium]|nr:F0F1 ATP synthase subunit A [Actinomycetaceae bacterium]MDY6082764.1 F0F1 ATP synthase subunit A [Actinomycetaceae bacterium]